MSLAYFLNTTVTVESPVDTRDDQGGIARTQWQGITVSSGIPASIQPLSHRERVMWGERKVYLSHKIYCSQDPKAKLGYRVTDDATGLHYVVEATRDVAGWHELWEMDVRLQVP